MNKEQAEIYVTRSLDMSKTISKSYQYKFLLLNLFCLGIAVALYQGLAFRITISFVACLNIFFVIIFAKRNPHIFKVTILILIQLTIFCIALNCIIFGMYKLAQAFVLWEFVVSIIIQIIALIVSFIFIKKHAERFKPKQRISKIEVIARATAGVIYALTLVLCRIFAPSLSAIITLIALLINTLVCMISLGVTAAFYRAFLIKKYGLMN